MIIKLKPKTRQVLQREIGYTLSSNNIRLLLRLVCIILISLDIDIEEVSFICQKSTRTIYNWVESFSKKKIEGLKYKKSPGAPSRLNKKQKNELKKMILENPEKNGYKTGVWNSAIIKKLILEKFGIEYSEKYIPQLLRNMDLSHKKVQSECKKGDKKKQKKWDEEIFPELVIKSIKEDAVILFEDESTFEMWSKSTYSWGEKGKPIIAEVSQKSFKQKIYGAIELNTGKLIYKLSKDNNSEEFLEYLKYLVKIYKGRKIYLVIDNGPIHKGKEIEDYLKKNKDKIELMRIPPYSPKLNPIEKIWKKLKQKNFHNRYFENEKEFMKVLRNGLREFQTTPELVVSVMKKYRGMYEKIKNELKVVTFEKINVRVAA